MKTAIIGTGNLLLMDEGIGVHVINELMDHELPQNVEIYDGGTGGYKLIDLMRGANTVIFIDAVDIGKVPGTILTFRSEDVRAVYQEKKYSLHDTSLLDVIKMVDVLDNPPVIKIIGIQPKTVRHGMSLSKELQESIPDIIKEVFNVVEDTYNLQTS